MKFWRLKPYNSVISQAQFDYCFVCYLHNIIRLRTFKQVDNAVIWSSMRLSSRSGWIPQRPKSIHPRNNRTFGLPLGRSLGWRSPSHGRIIPTRWVCVTDVKNKKKRTVEPIQYLRMLVCHTSVYPRKFPVLCIESKDGHDNLPVKDPPPFFFFFLAARTEP